MKTTGDVNARARRIASRGGWLLVALTILSLFATVYVRPQMFDNFKLRPWGAIFPLIVLAGIAGMEYFQRRGKEAAAFLSSTAYIAGMLGGAAFGLYPTMLMASTNPAYSLTIYNSKTGNYGMAVGLVWWSIGILLALGYFTYLYRSFRGKVTLAEGEEH
jgi:cytochrome d ubiquinol oxidase subunit II